jgi:hypothetical protein
MDSIMLGYPIGTFLFWKVKKTVINKKEYSMYEFIKDFHERDLYKNPPAPQPFPIGSDEEAIWAVLDGQQRLTSMYIRPSGERESKLPNKRYGKTTSLPAKGIILQSSQQRHIRR